MSSQTATIGEESFIGLTNLIDLYYPSTKPITQTNIIKNCGTAKVKIPIGQTAVASEGYQLQAILTVGSCRTGEFDPTSYSLFIFDPSENYKRLTIYGNNGIMTNEKWSSDVVVNSSCCTNTRIVFSNESFYSFI